MASAYKKRQWWQEAQGVSFVRPAPRAHSYVPCCSHEVGRRWRIIEGVPFFTHRRATLENGGAWFGKRFLPFLRASAPATQALWTVTHSCPCLCQPCTQVVQLRKSIVQNWRFYFSIPLQNPISLRSLGSWTSWGRGPSVGDYPVHCPLNNERTRDAPEGEHVKGGV